MVDMSEAHQYADADGELMVMAAKIECHERRLLHRPQDHAHRMQQRAGGRGQEVQNAS